MGDVVCTVTQAMEMCVRAYVHRWWYIRGPERRWNLFDCVILVMAVTELSVQHLGLTFLRFLRISRLLKAARLTRFYNYFSEAHKMFVSIKGSVVSLFWMLVVMGCIMYCTSICIVQGISFSLTWGTHRNVPQEDYEALQEHWGGVDKALYSTLAAISGGTDWQEFADPLAHFNPLLLFVFLVYVSFMFFGVLNVVTGVFVNAAIEASQSDRETATQTQLDAKASWVKNIRTLYSDATTNDTINQVEFEELLKNEDITAYLTSLDIDVTEARSLFPLLDLEQSGDIGVEEFVEGCIRLKGGATAVDLMTLTLETKRLGASMQDMMLKVDSSLSRLDVQLGHLLCKPGG